jgi:hypothetical protein
MSRCRVYVDTGGCLCVCLCDEDVCVKNVCK